MSVLLYNHFSTGTENFVILFFKQMNYTDFHNPSK